MPVTAAKNHLPVIGHSHGSVHTKLAYLREGWS